MLQVDLHTHTLFSPCGLHTYVEVLERAKALGIQAVAITDHGPAVKGKIPGPFFDRLTQPVSGVRMLKGMECNLVGDDGVIDLPEHVVGYLDIVLLGIHYNTPAGLGRDKYTEMLVAAIDHNPAVDVITHPNDTTYPVDFAAVAHAACARGVALELNNSKTALGRSPDEATRELVQAIKASGCRIVVSSDAHALNELGGDEAVRHFLEECRFPRSRIVSDSVEQALGFIEERRRFKV